MWKSREWLYNESEETSNVMRAISSGPMVSGPHMDHLCEIIDPRWEEQNRKGRGKENGVEKAQEERKKE